MEDKYDGFGCIATAIVFAFLAILLILGFMCISVYGVD